MNIRALMVVMLAAAGSVGAGAQPVKVERAVARDVSPRLDSMVPVQTEEGAEHESEERSHALAPQTARGAQAGPVTTVAPGSEKVEQTEQGTRPPARIVASFDGLGEGFEGPHGSARLRNPSDNSLAVGPDHIVQTVNT